MITHPYSFSLSVQLFFFNVKSAFHLESANKTKASSVYNRKVELITLLCLDAMDSA